MSDQLPPEHNDSHMPLVAHLTELRSRLLRIVAIWLLIVGAYVVAFMQPRQGLIA